MFIMKNNKVSPAHLKIASSPSYTVDELKQLMKEFIDTHPCHRDSSIRYDWALSVFVLWLAKREQGKGEGEGR